MKDIINHAIEEEEVGGGGSFSADDVSELRTELESQNDEELYNWWISNVGEWISSMTRWENDEYYENENKLSDWRAEEFDNVIVWQFNQLIETGSTEYGYIHPEYTQPY